MYLERQISFGVGPGADTLQARTYSFRNELSRAVGKRNRMSTCGLLQAATVTFFLDECASSNSFCSNVVVRWKVAFVQINGHKVEVGSHFVKGWPNWVAVRHPMYIITSEHEIAAVAQSNRPPSSGSSPQSKYAYLTYLAP